MFLKKLGGVSFKNLLNERPIVIFIIINIMYNSLTKKKQMNNTKLRA